MKQRPRWLWIVWASAATLAGIALLHAEPAQPIPSDTLPALIARPFSDIAEPSDQPWRAMSGFPDENRFLGTYDCERCHSRATQRDAARGVTERVCLSEWATWKEIDRHSRAYDSLVGAQGERMGRLLGRNVLDPQTGCLSCHVATTQSDRWATSCSGESGNDCVIEGVSCEACHGPSSRWVDGHRDYRTWQGLSTDERTERGWVEVRSPVARAELCHSCHLGSQRFGRVITHEMFAAGHPPLAGFEVESYADRMPRHWRYPYEKIPGKPSFARTRSLLIAGVVELRMAVELTVADATASAQGNRWPEFARFDCFACHHDLREPSWRQLQEEARFAGRMRPMVGCLPLIEVAARTAHGTAAQAEFQLLLRQLQEPFEEQLWGDVEKLRKLRPAVVDWCVSVEQELSSLELTPVVARGVLQDISQQAVQKINDYDTAKQLAGIWLAVYAELAANDAIAPPANSDLRLPTFGQPSQDEAPLISVLTIRQTCAEPAQPRLVEELFPAVFDRRSHYDPGEFSRLMSELIESAGIDQAPN